MTGIECTVNSRPLTYQYNDPEEVLTPSHLIFGRRLSPLSENIGTDIKIDADSSDNLSKRFIYLSRKLQHFWERWKREYLVDLRESHKIKNAVPVNIERGDVVVIHENNAKRGTWKTGVVEELISGKYGQVRGAKVRKTGRGKFEILTRPIQKLFLLEINARNERTGDKVENMSGSKEMREKLDENENENEEKKKQKDEGGIQNRPLRGAARNARILSKLTIDPLMGQGGGGVSNKTHTWL